MENTIIVVQVPSKKYAYNLELGLSFNDFVGQLVAHTVLSQVFEFLGYKITVPGASNSNDAIMRSFAVYVALNNAIFGNAKQDDCFEEGTPQYNWFLAINEVGMFGKVSHPSKFVCFTAFKGWKDNRKQRMEGQKNATLLLNHVREAETRKLKSLNKATKATLEAAIEQAIKELPSTF